MTTAITFYEGLRTIGGTFIAIETERAVCMFDFGFSVTERCDPRILMRPKHIAADCVRMGMLPACNGLYERRDARSLGLKSYNEVEKPHFLLISHMHIDHMGGLDMLDPKLPVYMTRDSHTLYRRLAAQGEFTYREHQNVIPLDPDTPMTIEDITFSAILVDHDVIGSCGFRIETPDGVIAYTGDYRFHGFAPERTRAFAQACRNADMLITEGVMVSFEDVDMRSLPDEAPCVRTEFDLLEEICSWRKKTSGLVLVNPYNRNVERLHRMVWALRAIDAELVLDAAAADYLTSFYPDDVPSVYAQTLRGRHVPAGSRLVEREELLSRPVRYTLQIDYADFAHLFDLEPVLGVYLHMDGAPLGDYDPSYAKMLAFLEALDVDVHRIGIGGHAYPHGLREMIETVHPNLLVPLHSFRPEQVDARGIQNRILPRRGETITLPLSAGA